MNGATSALPSLRRWALVTGASSGLGAEFARQLAARGHDVVITARRQDRLEELSAHLRAQHGVDVLVLTCDLGSVGGPAQLLDALAARDIVPSVLVNNAGFGVHGLAIEEPRGRQLEMIDLNVRALTALSLALGARMAARGSGAIINVGSTASFQPAPYVAVYAATKSYVLSFSEALAWELSSRGVHVLAHCPGPTHTEFFQAASMRVGAPEQMYMTSERCVALALRALDARRRVFVPGWLNAFGAWMVAYLPRRLVTAVSARVMRPIDTGRALPPP